MMLRKRKNKAGHAKYWNSLAVDIVSVEEKDATETRRYDKVVVRTVTQVQPSSEGLFQQCNGGEGACSHARSQCIAVYVCDCLRCRAQLEPLGLDVRAQQKQVGLGSEADFYSAE
jgi:hypothetical protein